MQLKRLSFLSIFLLILVIPFASPQRVHSQINNQFAKYIILMIGDGMGANHILAANLYTNQTP
ncbi:MAG: hypothetical protein ACPL0B_01960, partial [Anaerolineales bacterium]